MPPGQANEPQCPPGSALASLPPGPPGTSLNLQSFHLRLASLSLVASQLQQLSHTRHSLFLLHHHASSTCFRYRLPICQPTLPNATGFQPPKNRDALSPTSLPTEKKTGLCACCQHRRTCTFSAKVVGYPRTATPFHLRSGALQQGHHRHQLPIDSHARPSLLLCTK